jgi:glutamate dehydrogenase/leucine dehydrogenase
LLVEKLTSVDAFVVFDFEDAPTALGVVRSAPKILVDGATWLARSQTYQLAIFEQRAGGASAGINARPEARTDAIAAFVTEIEPWVASRRFLPDAARGVQPDQLAPLRAADPRPDDYWARRAELAAAGLEAATIAAVGGLDGRSVVIEGFDETGLELARRVVAQGGSVAAVSTADGTAVQPSGLSIDALDAAWAAHGADLVRELVPDLEPPGRVFGVTADILVCGSRTGIVDHGVAAGCDVKALVPSGPIPVTAKALAVLQRAGVVVLPDFVTTAGPLLGAALPALDGEGPPLTVDDVAATIGAVITDVLSDESGPVLGACLRAEAFMRTWRDELPFGRPLA